LWGIGNELSRSGHGPQRFNASLELKTQCLASFEVDALVANVKAVLDELVRSKPAVAKGQYLKRITISSTMSPGVRINPTVVES